MEHIITQRETRTELGDQLCDGLQAIVSSDLPHMLKLFSPSLGV
jgi:hypothetical protein